MKQALKFCDASSVDELLNVYSHFGREKKFEKNLIEFMGKNELERSASWLLKHHLEQGFMLSDRLANSILQTFPKLEHWEARLHILQLLSLLYICDSEVDNLWDSVVIQTQDSNKLIRAWAYNGLHEIAVQFPSFKEKASQYFKIARENDEAGSVIARIKKIVKAGDYSL